MGFDARVMAETSDDAKRRWGQLAYFRTALTVAGAMRPVPYRLTVDGDVFDVEAALVLAINCGELIPGLVAPRLTVIPDDGLLDVLVIRGGGWLPSLHGAARALLSAELLERAPLKQDASFRMRAADVLIDPVEPQPFQIDGHPFDHAGSLEVSVRPGMMRVLVPPGRRPGKSG